MNSLIEDNRCHSCKKLFCCSSCRELHEQKKHPRPKTDANCCLCLSKKLRLEKFEDAKFLCHLVIRHLPLMCVLCGQVYRSSSDLQSFKRCEFWQQQKNGNSLPPEQVKKLSAQVTPSPITKTLSCPAYCRKESPSVDSEFHSLQSFAFPQELMRNTSTPMHGSVADQRSVFHFNNKTSKFPSFFLKTPKTPMVEENPSPTLYYSATSQLLTSKDINTDSCASAIAAGSISSSSKSFDSVRTPSRSTAIANRMSEGCSGYSREFFKTNSSRALEVMEEQEEQTSICMDLTEAQDNLQKLFDAPKDTDSPTAPKDFAKKVVRFSDQHQIMADSTADPVSDNEEFYEAPEILGEKSACSVQNDSEARIVQQNEDNSDKENVENREDSESFKTPLSTPSATSSRVVMMVVVENGFEISTSKLMPLINSSLEKLDQSKSLTKNMTSSLPNVSSHIQHPSSSLVRSISSIDSYTASSTDYYYETPNTSSMTPVEPQKNTSESLTHVGGIFSAVAQVMRNAFRGLPGTGPSKGSPTRVSETLSESRGLNSTGLRTSPSRFSTMATSLLRRPGKRSRDSINDAVSPYRRELRSPRNETGYSPVAKRPRSWHRIRGRDPIARMRRDASTTTRGVSSETQHFQQGSLSAGDTILPIPSRAHQSTQTD
ncbi:uncharacterized protein LOC124183069 isoform X1 [Neodiprion fabricii]|uniref:uncharacterized protein LOC124183069 isoform X1 n=2 Tax=Neodiprion fabricii TaxID=2872261 RepID=UPI001ED8EE77|nr:uncharacterized protein LOC124183069 isoform X1 [Neodiprion fabricii]